MACETLHSGRQQSETQHSETQQSETQHSETQQSKGACERQRRDLQQVCEGEGPAASCQD